MSRAPQSSRPNVPPQLSHRQRQQLQQYFHQHQQQQQAQQQQQQQQPPPPPSPPHSAEYYYEDDVMPMSEEAYIGDYIGGPAPPECLRSLQLGAEPPPPGPPQARHELADIYRQHHLVADATGQMRAVTVPTVDMYQHKLYYPMQQQPQPSAAAQYYYDPRITPMSSTVSTHPQSNITPQLSAQNSGAPSASAAAGIPIQRRPSTGHASVPPPPTPPPISSSAPVYRKRLVMPQTPQATASHYYADEELSYRQHMLQRQQQQQQQQQQQRQYEQMHMQQQPLAHPHTHHLHPHIQQQMIHAKYQQQQQQKQQQQQQHLEQQQQQQKQQDQDSFRRAAKPKSNMTSAGRNRVDHVPPATAGGPGGHKHAATISGKKEVASASQGTGTSSTNSSQSKRHPVTVRTPRYIRRPINSSLYKRPSALCIPLAVQPDPALSSRRLKRMPVNLMYTSRNPSEQLEQTDDLQQIPPPMESPFNDIYMQASQRQQEKSKQMQQQQKQQQEHEEDGKLSMGLTLPEPPISLKNELEMNAPDKIATSGSEEQPSTAETQSRLDAILQRYDRLFRDTNDTKVDFNGTGDAPKHMNLKPRPPPCLKEKEKEMEALSKLNKADRLDLPDTMKSVETLQVEEMTTDMLDELLSELTEHGFSDVSIDDQRKRMGKRAHDQQLQSLAAQVQSSALAHEECPVKDIPKSFNYTEIKDSMSKSKIEFSESEDNGSTLLKDVCSKKSETSTTMRSKSKIPRVLVDDAMELHRTKSYVVNLIDTALSSHFGTTLGSPKHPKKEKLDASSAVEMLKKQASTTSSKHSNKELAEEIAQVLSDNFTAHSSRHSNISKGISQCSCKSTVATREEPLFVKQLRQMRWGHLKHIQQEVRRLEELERFLDSCNLSTFDKCPYH